MITAVEAVTRRELKEFIRFPFTLYKGDPNFSPELIRDQQEHFSSKNPFFNHAEVKFFLARDGSKILGRVASIVNHAHNTRHDDKAGFFGFFESVDSRDVSGTLLKRVSEELQSAGLQVIRGPMNFSTNEQCGLLIEGYDAPPMLLTPYNPPYYHSLLEDFGMYKSKDLLAFVSTPPAVVPEKIARVAKIAEKKGIRVRQIKKELLNEELMIFGEIYNESWKNNWGFIPLEKDELAYMSKKLKQVIAPELTFIAEKDREAVGFLGFLPDFNLVLRKMMGKITPLSILKALYYHSRIEDLRLLLFGVKPRYRHRGVDAIMLREATLATTGRYKRYEFSWVLEDNEPVKSIAAFGGGKVYKRYRIYEKDIAVVS